MKYIWVVIFLAGCAAKATTHYVQLQPRPNYCQVTEVRPTMFGTQLLGVCWDHNTEVIGMTGSGGEATITVPLAVLGAGATVGGAYILGSYLKQGAEGIPNSFNLDHTLEVVPVLPE